MEIKYGDKVVLDGVESKCIGIWAQGAHTRYNLEDGRFIHSSLEELYKAGRLRVLINDKEWAERKETLDQIFTPEEVKENVKKDVIKETSKWGKKFNA